MSNGIYRYVIGIDPSISSTGLACWSAEEGNENAYLVKAIKTTARGQQHLDKLIRHEKAVTAIANHVPTESVVFYEGPSYGSKGSTFHDLAGFWWRLYGTLARTPGVDVIVVTPGQLKKFVTGSGNADKAKVMLAADRRWPHLGITGDDTADACGLMQMGRVMLREAEFEMPKANLDALKDVPAGWKVA